VKLCPPLDGSKGWMTTATGGIPDHPKKIRRFKMSKYALKAFHLNVGSK
jgi:hypothetical protein